MAKIYGTPIMAGGAGGANADLPPLLDNFKAVTGEEENTILVSADKMEESRAEQLAGAVWVYGDHSPANVNDGTKIQLTREEVIYIKPDFPTEPTEWSEVTKITNSQEYTFPEVGWFKIVAVAGGGNGGKDMRKVIGASYGGAAGGGGGTGGISVSKISVKDIDNYKISVELSEKNIVIKNTEISMSVTSGGDGANGYAEDSPGYYVKGGKGGDSGTASGGNLENKQGNAGGDGDATKNPDTSLVDAPGGSPGEDTIYDEYRSTGGIGGGVINYSSDGKRTDGSDAFVVILRGNTNITTQRETSTNPDTIVQKSIPWSKTKDFYARQFTYNSKKQYQTMLEGAIATLVLTGVPDPVTELAETHSGSSITLTWKNPTSDELYDHTVVVYKTDAFPTAIDDGTQGYSGTDETAILSGLELGITYYIAVFTVSAYGLYGEPQTVQVEIPAGQLLSSLASGTKVKLGQWNGTDLQWKVARDTSDQSIRLVLEPTSVSLLGNKMYDNKEPSNSDTNRRNYGNNRYIYSNIHQWLNATEATSWYTAQHSTDAAPDYSSQAGFLSGWSENHIAALDRATLTVSRSNTDGGGTETFAARVALISTTELGLQSNTGGGRLDIFNSNGDRATGSVYWTRTPYPSIPNYAYRVASAGALDTSFENFVYSAYGVRPLCSPKSTVLVSLEMDDDGCYVVQ